MCRLRICLNPLSWNLVRVPKPTLPQSMGRSASQSPHILEHLLLVWLGDQLSVYLCGVLPMWVLINRTALYSPSRKHPNHLSPPPQDRWSIMSRGNLDGHQRQEIQKTKSNTIHHTLNRPLSVSPCKRNCAFNLTGSSQTSVYQGGYFPTQPQNAKKWTFSQWWDPWRHKTPW